MRPHPFATEGQQAGYDRLLRALNGAHCRRRSAIKLNAADAPPSVGCIAPSRPGLGLASPSRQGTRPRRHGRRGEDPLHLVDPAEVGAADEESRCAVASSRFTAGAAAWQCVPDCQYCRWSPAWVVVAKHRCGRVAIGPKQPAGISILIGRTSNWYGNSLLPPGSPPNLMT